MAAERTRTPRRLDNSAGASRGARRGARGAYARGDDGRQGQSIASLQRSRLINAAVGLLAERGHSGFSAAAVSERAGVSRRTFYEVFENREACLSAILTDTEAHLKRTIAGMGLQDAAWQERMRMGLWALLCLADREPALVKACLVESLERERIVHRLASIIDEGRLQGTRASIASELTAEALVGAATSVISARLTVVTQRRPASDHRKREAVVAQRRAVSSDRRSSEVVVAQRRAVRSDHGSGEGLRSLLGELMGMIVLPYLGPAAARREIKRPLPNAPVGEIGEIGVAGGPDPLAGLPVRLTYRTARVLQAVAALGPAGPGASNRRIADHAGISDAGQISKLLSRLQANGLVENAAADIAVRGEANDWQLTSRGTQLVQSITTAAAKRNAA